MKNLQKILALMLFGLLLISCEKSEPNGGVYKDLTGTVWEADVSDYLTYYSTKVFEFTTSTSGKYYYIYPSGKKTSAKTITYSYDYPTITISGLTYTFSNKWTFRRTTYKGIELVFSEQ